MAELVGTNAEARAVSVVHGRHHLPGQQHLILGSHSSCGGARISMQSWGGTSRLDGLSGNMGYRPEGLVSVFFLTHKPCAFGWHDPFIPHSASKAICERAGGNACGEGRPHLPAECTLALRVAVSHGIKVGPLGTKPGICSLLLSNEAAGKPANVDHLLVLTRSSQIIARAWIKKLQGAV